MRYALVQLPTVLVSAGEACFTEFGDVFVCILLCFGCRFHCKCFTKESAVLGYKGATHILNMNFNSLTLSSEIMS